MYCKECGTQLPDGSTFCDNCGAKQDTASSMTAPSRTGSGNENSSGGPKLPPVPDYVNQKTPPTVNDQPVTNRAPSNSASLNSAPSNSMPSGDKPKKDGGLKKILLYVGIGIVALFVLLMFLGRERDPDNDVTVDTYPENYVDKSPDSDTQQTNTEEVAKTDAQVSGAVTGKEGAGDTSDSAATTSADAAKDLGSGKLSEDEQKKVADDLTTTENAYATEFDWLIDKVFNISKGEWANETDPEYCRRIEGDEAALLNGGWKCFICEGEMGYYTGQYERYLNAVVDTDGNKFTITLNWNLWYTDAGAFEEEGQEILRGKWDSSQATVHTASSMGNVDFTDFYITHDNLGEYAVGTLQWNSGEVDHIGLMRSVNLGSGSAAAPSSTAGLSDQETLLIERAKKLSGAPEAEIEENPDGTVTIHLFETVDDGDGQSHTATWDWYTIDPKTMKGTNFMEEEIDLSE